MSLEKTTERPEYPQGMEIEVRQRGGLLGLDRQYLVKDGAIEVIEKGEPQGSQSLDPQQAARIDELARSAHGARVQGADELASDDMETTVAIHRDEDSSSLKLHSGDVAPREVWDLIGEISRAFGA
jgi:hypothetical protein